MPGEGYRLVLMRHAKAGYPSGAVDHERPLKARGRRDAAAAGAWLAEHVPRPDVVLCSTAVRTRQTWEVARSALPAQGLYQEVPELYQASADDLLDVVAAALTALSAPACLLVIGHQPAVGAVAAHLAGAGSSRPALAALREKFATSGIAVLRLQGRDALAPGGAVLEAFAVPRGSR